MRSFSSSRRYSAMLSVAKTRPAWLCITPFGLAGGARGVDERGERCGIVLGVRGLSGRTRGSPRGTSSSPPVGEDPLARAATSATAASAISAEWDSATRNLAPLSLRMKASLSGLRLRVHERERPAGEEHAEDGDGAVDRVVQVERDPVAVLEARVLQRPRRSGARRHGAPRTSRSCTRRRSRPCRAPSRRTRAGCPGRAPSDRLRDSARRRPCLRRRSRTGSSAGAGRGFATSRSLRIISDIEPASAISSVSLTGRPSANLATSRATAVSSSRPASAHRLGLEQRAVAPGPEEDVADRRAVGHLRPRPDRLGKYARDGSSAARTSPGARAAGASPGAVPPARRAVRRRTGSGPRSSAPSASGRPACAAGSPRRRSRSRRTAPSPAARTLEAGRERGAESVRELALGLGLAEQFRVEHPQRAGGVLEAEPVAVERIVGREQVLRVEAGQERAGARGVGREPAVEPAEEQRAELWMTGRAPRSAAPCPRGRCRSRAKSSSAASPVSTTLSPASRTAPARAEQRGGRGPQHRLLGELDRAREQPPRSPRRRRRSGGRSTPSSPAIASCAALSS